jgi:hypothetical protein
VKQLFGSEQLSNHCLDPLRQEMIDNAVSDVPIVGNLAINLDALVTHGRPAAGICTRSIKHWFVRSRRGLGHLKIQLGTLRAKYGPVPAITHGTKEGMGTP